MSEQPPVYLDANHPLGRAAVHVIRTGDVPALRRLLAEHPELSVARIDDPAGASRSLLHIATDWPGHFPDGPETVRTLIKAGADVGARFTGPHTETPMHWAASRDDAPALDVLLDAGADIDAPGAVIGGGTPLDDAVAFGQWNAARRLVQRGARTSLWTAAALGLLDRVAARLRQAPPPTTTEITQAFWCSCRGGQRPTAECLLDNGTDVNWIGYDGLTPLDAAGHADAAELTTWLRARGARTAAETETGTGRSGL
ncbi:putative Palmitoyltransferase AKR1 [Frankia sp. Hr75.2]|nr:putative Palmitoyltransferase AKR1 [Frankia sp. Hr75.2]